MLFVGWLCMEFCGSSSLVVCLSSCGVLRLDSVGCGVFELAVLRDCDAR